jgi:hypothetical protein
MRSYTLFQAELFFWTLLMFLSCCSLYIEYRLYPAAPTECVYKGCVCCFVKPCYGWYIIRRTLAHPPQGYLWAFAPLFWLYLCINYSLYSSLLLYWPVVVVWAKHSCRLCVSIRFVRESLLWVDKRTKGRRIIRNKRGAQQQHARCQHPLRSFAPVL